MIAFELITEAIRNLARHKLRSFLTALGIIIGIASVMAMVSTGEGARQAILEQIGQLGVRNIIINAHKPPEDKQVSNDAEGYRLEYGLTFQDADQIAHTVPNIASVLQVHDVEESIWFKSRKLLAKVRGVAPAYYDTLKLAPFLGRLPTDLDGQQRNRVCVVRPRLLREAKYVGDPLSLDLRIGSEYFRVIGLLPDVGFHSPNQSALGLDDRSLEVYVPFETVVDRYGLTQTKSKAGAFENTRVELHQIVCEVDTEAAVLDTARCVHAVLQKFHDKKDYEVVVPLELLESRQKTQQVFNIVLPIVAGISLLVGGIGILNIMLASVTERIREIGIRRAIGATRLDISLQFLVETVTLTAIGGLIGVLGGVGGTYLVEIFTEWQPVITLWAVLLSLAISAATGIVFGLYPARRAALMDPIQALRHE